jgi:hypothetical protein
MDVLVIFAGNRQGEPGFQFGVAGVIEGKYTVSYN